MRFYFRVAVSLFLFFFSIFVYIKYLRIPQVVLSVDSEMVFSENQNLKTQNLKFISTKCTNSIQVNFSKKRQTFQPVLYKGNLNDIYVFSAFYDSRSTKKLVIISALKSIPTTIYCVVWFANLNYSRVMTGSVSLIPEQGTLYKGSFIYCPLQNDDQPRFVSVVVNDPCDKLTNLIKVKTFPRAKILTNFAVCVTPFNLAYNKVDQFLEMISINQVLGADHVYFYNYSIGYKVEKILQRLIKARYVTVIQWHLPMKVHVWPIPPGYQEEIKYFGQMAMLQDCLYRAMGHYKYVSFSDLDEFLIPRKQSNWRQMFRELLDVKYSDYAGWLFRNIFFKTEWPSDPVMEKNKTIVALNVTSLLKVRREATIYPAYQRSKLLVDPLKIDVMGVHNVWSFHSTGGVNNAVAILSPEEGLCHHYRFWDGLGQTQYVEDRGIFHLREKIVSTLTANKKQLLL